MIITVTYASTSGDPRYCGTQTYTARRYDASSSFLVIESLDVKEPNHLIPAWAILNVDVKEV